MAAHNIAQERLIFCNLVCLFLFRAPQFALFPLPSRATSLLSILPHWLPISLLLLFFFSFSFFFPHKILFFYVKGLSLVSASLSLHQDHISHPSPTSPHQAPSWPGSSSPFFPGGAELIQPPQRAHSPGYTLQSFSHSFPPQPTALCSFGTGLFWRNPTHLWLDPHPLPSRRSFN